MGAKKEGKKGVCRKAKEHRSLNKFQLRSIRKNEQPPAFVRPSYQIGQSATAR